MGKMGNGYGSEFHLLRYLARHLHSLIIPVSGGTSELEERLHELFLPVILSAT